MLDAGKYEESVMILEEIDRELLRWPELDAKYEAAVAHALEVSGNRPDALRHYERARRVFGSLDNVQGITEVARLGNGYEADGNTDGLRNVSSTTGDIVQNIASLMSHVGRPELVATGVIAVLRDTACVDAATALVVERDGTERTLASFPSPPHVGVREAPPSVLSSWDPYGNDSSKSVGGRKPVLSRSLLLQR